MSAKPVILVADDDQPILLLMRNILREFGFEPRVADSGTAAVASARELPPDLVLLDKNMPGSKLDDVIRGLREVCPAPVIILSGEPLDADEIAAAGAAGAVLKPFDVAELMGLIRAVVGVARR